MKPILRIGTRGSQLALYQAELVKMRIRNNFPLLTVEIVKIKTGGDMIRRGGTSPFATKRIYTKEIEDALLGGEVDFAVHSAKDMAALLPEGLEIGAALEREDPRDCLVSKDHKKISELPLGARIGTSSLRRKMQLLRWNPELVVEEVHGNVDSRIRKIQEGEYDAVVLAYAGMKRLGLLNYVAEVFPEDRFYPAPGQGIIAVESRSGDSEAAEILKAMNHPPTAARLECERAFLSRMEGGCQLPCGISTAIEKQTLKAAGVLFAVEGHDRVEEKLEGEGEPAGIGKGLAEIILNRGGREILEKIRHGTDKRKEQEP